jgi:hypothetical protein
MTGEHYIYLSAFILLISVLINILLFIRLDLANKFIRYSRLSMAILHLELEKVKHEYESTKGSDGSSETSPTEPKDTGSSNQ